MRGGRIAAAWWPNMIYKLKERVSACTCNLYKRTPTHAWAQTQTLTRKIGIQTRARIFTKTMHTYMFLLQLLLFNACLPCSARPAPRSRRRIGFPQTCRHSAWSAPWGPRGRPNMINKHAYFRMEVSSDGKGKKAEKGWIMGLWLRWTQQ